MSCSLGSEITYRAHIAAGLSVEFHWRAPQLSCEWSPASPRARLRGQALRRYRAARHVMLERIAAALGGSVACIEYPEPRLAGVAIAHAAPPGSAGGST